MHVGKRKVAVFDLETDPFEHGRRPEAFAAGFFDGDMYREFWGDDCVKQLLDFLEYDYSEPLLLYAHNGGKFDFFFLLEHLENPVKLIKGRIVEAALGKHKLRDSYAAIPIPLAAYSKLETDYATFERNVREKYKADILHYLAYDCESLYSLITKFLDRFGPKLTIGSTAIKALESMHTIPHQNASHDAKFRPFYHGGRCEFFARGILPGPWKYYDVNSMYPYVMRNRKHPIGKEYEYGRNIDSDSPFFARIVAKNNGALPFRDKGGLRFDVEYGEFECCSHELNLARDLGLVEVVEVIETYTAKAWTSFADYVDLYSAEKIAAKNRGDKPSEIFAKLLLNSAYGKTAQNPAEYFDYSIRRHGEPLPFDYELYADSGDIEIWRRPSPGSNYIDVAIGASITSASRAVLLDALAKADGAIYCDTDSIICRSLSGVELDETKLGAWKVEADADEIALAGKKLYAVYQNRKCVKSASKGVSLTPSQIRAVARGRPIKTEKLSPAYKLDGSVEWVARTANLRDNVSAGIDRHNTQE